MPMPILRMAFLLAVAVMAAGAVDSWPQFRGPQSLGTAADDPNLPDTWSTTDNVAWKIDIPGNGWSSPVVWGNRIFVTSTVPSSDAEKPKKGLYFGGERKAPSDEHRWMVYAID